MKKVFKVAHIRDLEKQVIQEQISYSRMVEIMNEMAHKAYTKVEKLPIHSVSNSLLDLDGKTIPVTFHVANIQNFSDMRILFNLGNAKAGAFLPSALSDKWVSCADTL